MTQLKRPRMIRCRRPPTAFLVVGVLACMSIASLMTLMSLRQSLAARRQLQRETHWTQTRWLVDAGLTRALIARRADPSYRGETWDASPAIRSCHGATVRIHVQSIGEDAEAFIIVTATFVPDGTTAKPIRQTRRWRTIDDAPAIDTDLSITNDYSGENES